MFNFVHLVNIFPAIMKGFHCIHMNEYTCISKCIWYSISWFQIMATLLHSISKSPLISSGTWDDIDFGFWGKIHLPHLTFANTLGPSQHRRRFADDIFKCIFFNENCCILIKISLKFVRKDPIDNNPALVQIMAWRRLGDKPFSEPMMVRLPTHICVARPQWANRV